MKRRLYTRGIIYRGEGDLSPGELFTDLRYSTCSLEIEVHARQEISDASECTK